MRKENCKYSQLTALVRRFCEGSCDFRVEVDHGVVDLGHLLVPSLDAVVDPVDEPLPEDDAEAVGRVLPRPLQHLLGRREELTHLLELGGEGEHLGHLQALV